MRTQHPQSSRGLIAPRGALRRGITFLEVMLAVALLALVTAMIMVAINTMMAAQIVQRQRLGAAELANGMILTYLDDKQKLPSSSSMLNYGRDLYRWSYTEQPATLKPAREEQLTARGNSSISLNRIKSVTFHVWLSEKSGGVSTLDEAAGSSVHMALSRIVDPVALRNPDAIERMLKDPKAYQEFIANFTNNPGSPAGRPVQTKPAPDSRGKGKPAPGGGK